MESPEPRLSEIELRYLKLLIDYPGEPSSRYARLAGMNGRRAAEIRQSLLQRGYVRERSVATSARGRNAIVLEPLKPALDAVAQAQAGGSS